MRKQFKQKLKSCALCKPHKMHWANRWKTKDRAKMKVMDKEIKDNGKD